MGWLTWTRFLCNIDIVNDPENAISQHLIVEMADRMYYDGYLDAGYEYVIIDDCWSYGVRDSDGRLMPNPHRFPLGIKKLADYVRSAKLLFG